jgi:hypothetical protein
MIQIVSDWPRPFVSFLAASLCFVIAACGAAGPEMGAVSGRVTYKGNPVSKGNVAFIPTDVARPPSSGTINADGTYSLATADGRSGAQLGEYKVAVTGTDDPNQDIPGMPLSTKSQIPKKYADADKSDLKATVKSGSNTHNIELVD